MKKKLRILMVEDSESDAYLTLNSLINAGYEVDSVRVETAQALAQALKESEDWDLILSDYCLAKFSAPLALTMLKQTGFDIPFIIVSGTIGEERAVSTMRAGARDFILKSDLKRLIPVIERELREADARRLKRKVEQAYRDSEKRYRQIVNTANEGIWLIDANGLTVFVNKAMAQMLDFHEQNILGKPLTDFLYHSNFVDPKTFLEKIKTHNPSQLDLKFICKEGRALWALASITSMFEDNGSFQGALLMATDVTDRKFLAEAGEILASSLDYATTLQSVAQLAISHIADLCILELIEPGESVPRLGAIAHANSEKTDFILELRKKYLNNANDQSDFATILRTGMSKLHSQLEQTMPALDVNTPEHHKFWGQLGVVSAMIVPLKARGKILGTITFIADESGRHFTENNLAVAEDLGKRAGLAIENTRLYSEQVKARQEMEVMTADLQKAIKVRDDFLSIASHELRTPLTSLTLQTQLRKRAIQKGDFARFTPDKLRRLIEDDEKQINRLTRLVDDMFDIARLHSGKFKIQLEKMDLTLLVEDVFERFKPQFLAAGYEISVEAAPSVIGMWDRYRIEQVFTNLLTNALKYGDSKPVNIKVLSDGHTAKLIVKDHGIGIADESRDRIFGQFERAISAENISGLGLGLYIVKQIVEAHAGKIYLDSKLEMGTTFTIELPQTLNT